MPIEILSREQVGAIINWFAENPPPVLEGVIAKFVDVCQSHIALYARIDNAIEPKFKVGDEVWCIGIHSEYEECPTCKRSTGLKTCTWTTQGTFTIDQTETHRFMVGERSVTYWGFVEAETVRVEETEALATEAEALAECARRNGEADHAVNGDA